MKYIISLKSSYYEMSKALRRHIIFKCKIRKMDYFRRCNEISFPNASKDTLLLYYLFKSLYIKKENKEDLISLTVKNALFKLWFFKTVFQHMKENIADAFLKSIIIIWFSKFFCRLVFFSFIFFLMKNIF